MSFSSRFVSTQWALFAKSTGIKAFTFLIHSQNIYEKVLWTLTITCGIVVTLMEVVETSKYYWSEPTMTRMIIKTEKTFSLGPITFCTALFPVKPNSSAKIDEILYSLSNIPNMTLYFEEQLAKVRRQINQTRLDDPSLHKSVLDDKFIQFLDLEADFLVTSQLSEIHGSPIDPVWDTLYKFNLNRIGPIDKVLKLIGSALWAQLGLTVRINQDYKEGKPVNHIDIDQVGWFGLNPLDKDPIDQITQLCIFISPDVTNFSSRLSYLSIQIDSSPPIRNTLPLAIVINSDPVSSADSENLQNFPHSCNTSLNVKLAGKYKSMSKSCSNENQTYIQCLLECLEDKFSSNHSCRPNFGIFVRRNSSLRFCDYQFQSPNAKNFRYEALEACKDHCKVPCQQRIFSFAASGTVSTPNVTKILIFIEAFTYPSFEEVLAVSFRQFLAQLGGNLSLWLGASFLVLLHVFIFLIQLPSSYNRWKSMGEEPRAQEMNCNCDCEKRVKVRQILYDGENRAELRSFIRQCVIAESDKI